MKAIKTCLLVFIVTVVLTGLLYPALITVIAQTVFKDMAQGSIVKNNGKIVGSYLIAQKFDKDKYFWPRPSAVDYSPMPSGGSNLSATSKALRETIRSRKISLLASDRSKKEVQIPSDLIYASGSGLDPHISPASALFQSDRVAKARHIAKKKLIELINKATEKRYLSIFGEPRVNVLKLNLLLDSLAGKE
jgi:potassium-transporting ATPase KdpC subunit